MSMHVDQPAEQASPNRVELLDSLRSEERKAAVSRVASTLSHALGTPLNVIAGRAAMINMDGVSPEDMRSNARIIEQQVRGIAAMLRQVLNFARDSRAELETCDARSIAGRALQVLEELARVRRVNLVLSQGPAVTVQLHIAAALQILTNLISLGVRREPAGGSVQLGVALEHVEPPSGERGRVSAGQYVRFLVTYASTGLPPTLFSAVYEPWFNAECVDSDAALVLAMSYGVAREHRGWIESRVESNKSALVVNWPAA